MKVQHKLVTTNVKEVAKETTYIGYLPKKVTCKVYLLNKLIIKDCLLFTHECNIFNIFFQEVINYQQEVSPFKLIYGCNL